MPRSSRHLAALATTALLALRLAACSDDEVAPTDAPGAGAGAGANAAAEAEAGPSLADGEASTPPGEGEDAASSGPRPSFCDGMLFYASFDQGFGADVGATLARAGGTAAIGAGKFGAGLALVTAGGVTGVDGGAIFYDQIDGGAPIYASTEGSIAFWFRRRAPSGPGASFVRPLAALANVLAAGPATAQTTNTPGTGLFEAYAGKAFVALPDAELQPFLRAADFNHVVTAWRAPVDGGPPGFAQVVVNGGLGEVLTDAGARDAAADDASPDAVGNVRTPYFQRSVVSQWPTYQPLVSLRIGGNSSTTPPGDMDDVAIWDRELTGAEIAALYASPGSIRVACKLP